MELPASLKKRWFITGIPVALGAAAGFAYYHYIGCASGACPLTGNPWTSTAYGGLIGFLLAPRHRPKQDAAPAGPTEGDNR